MDIYYFPEKPDFKTSVALGCFDGVHKGHTKVINECKKTEYKSGVLLFSGEVKKAECINTLEERTALIEEKGVDFVYVCEFDEKIKSMSPEEFVLFLKNTLNAAAVSVGFNYKFGYKASGDCDTLKNLGEKYGIDVKISRPERICGEVVSSTNIRNSIAGGDLEKAEKLLGYNFFITGTVGEGFKNGRKLGFRTANVTELSGRVLPPDGVYSGRTYVGGKSYASVVNVGKNPTFGGKVRTAETHLLDFDGDIYGEKIKIEFRKFIRGEIKFDGPEEIKKQIALDAERARIEMMELYCIISADDTGSEMKSDTPRYLHKICGKTIIDRVKEAAEEAGCREVRILYGNNGQAAAELKKRAGGTIVAIYGDVPLITAEEIRLAVRRHGGNSATSFSYGENPAMYVFSTEAVNNVFKETEAGDNRSFADIFEALGEKGASTGKISDGAFCGLKRINNRIDLAEAEKVMQKRINEAHMKNGVTIILPETVIIEDGVEIGRDTVVYPNVILESGTKIGKNCVIGSNTRITASEIADNVEILNSVLKECKIDEGADVGPFAYIRPNTHVGKSVHVGDFVELKNSDIDDGTKIAHLTYVGDSDVGKRVNFGCGTVTVNYDGKKKYRTKIGDDCFIGCNTNLVAPVEVKNGGYTAAGSTVTDTVPENNLAIARARQINKENWKDRRK